MKHFASILAFGLSLVAPANEWIPAPATDGSVTAIIITAGGITYAEHLVHLPHTGLKFDSFGPLRKEGSSFSREVTFLRSTSEVVLPVVSGLISSSVIGALTNGTYRYNLTSFGTNIFSTTFTIPPPPDQSTYPPNTIYSSAFLTNGVFKVNVTVPVFLQYVLQASPDLVHWTNISTNSGGRFLFPDGDAVLDPEAPAHQRRFYRLELQP